MRQAPGFDGLSFDPFSLFQNGLASSEVDVSGREVLQALVVATVIATLDEGVNLLREIARQIVVFLQDAVLEGLMPAPVPSLNEKHRPCRGGVCFDTRFSAYSAACVLESACLSR